MEELLTLYQAAQKLGLTQRTLKYNAVQGLIPALRLKKEDGTEYFMFSIPLIEEAIRKNGSKMAKPENPLKRYQPGRLGYVQV